jgi:PAS domain S-box-containing protein
MNTEASALLIDEDSGLTRERERCMHDSLNEFMESIEDVPVHAADLDMDGVYVSWDAVAQRILGYAFTEVVGNMHFCCMFADAHDFTHVWHTTQERDWFSGRMLLRRSDGTTFFVWLTLAKTFDAASSHTGYRVTAIAADDQRHMLRAYMRHMEKMNRLQKMAEEETRATAHEDICESIPPR